jgi:hypothetical protein
MIWWRSLRNYVQFILSEEEAEMVDTCVTPEMVFGILSKHFWIHKE